MKFYATCKLGLESLVVRQLHDLGIIVEKTEDARVTFSGGESELMRALLWLRTAERVLLVVGEFEATSFDALFEGTKAVDWRPYLRANTTIHVNGKSAKSALFSVSDCQRIVKKAIIESLRASLGRAVIPEGGDEVIVEVGLMRNQASLCIDCCGAGLSRRGYRTYNVAAPLSETLGAAIVLLSRYRGDVPLVDPMCGSGTMPIEAAMIAEHIAPGLKRSFACENWWFANQSAFSAERASARDARVTRTETISGADIDPRCVALSKKHADKAGVCLEWSERDVKDLTLSDAGGILVCNPPYGERMLDRQATETLYREMRRVFSRYPAWSYHIFSGVRDFERIYAKRADRRRKLTNGGMVCTLYQYYG